MNVLVPLVEALTRCWASTRKDEAVTATTRSDVKFIVCKNASLEIVPTSIEVDQLRQTPPVGEIFMVSINTENGWNHRDVLNVFRGQSSMELSWSTIDSLMSSLFAAANDRVLELV